MGLTASNEVQDDWAGSIPKLLHFGQRRTIMLGDEVELMRSYDDMKGAFYMFRLASIWTPLFSFVHR